MILVRLLLVMWIRSYIICAVTDLFGSDSDDGHDGSVSGLKRGLEAAVGELSSIDESDLSSFVAGVGDSGANVYKFEFVDPIGNLEKFIDKVVGMLDVEKRLAAEAEGAKLLRALDKSVLVAFEELSDLLAELNAVCGKHSSLLEEIVKLQSAVRTKTESAII